MPTYSCWRISQPINRHRSRFDMRSSRSKPLETSALLNRETWIPAVLLHRIRIPGLGEHICEGFERFTFVMSVPLNLESRRLAAFPLQTNLYTPGTGRGAGSIFTSYPKVFGIR